MKQEAQIAAEFIASYLPEHERLLFTRQLVSKLEIRLMQCWHPKQPEKGSSFRAIKVFDRIDPILKMDKSQFSLHLLPSDFIVWIDPKKVCFRQGNNYVNDVWIDDESDKRQVKQPKGVKKGVKVTISRPPLSPPKQEGQMISRLHTIQAFA